MISTVTLRCVPAFRLAAVERPVPLDEVLDRFDELAAANDHFEFFWFPYGRHVLVKLNNRVAGPPARPPRRRPCRAGGGSGSTRSWTTPPSAPFAGPGARCPSLVRPLARLAAATLSSRSYSADSHLVFVTPRRVRFVESEYAVPRHAILDVLAELRRVVPRLSQPVMFPIEVRVAAADDIWLSTAYGRDTAYIAIHQYTGMPYQDYFAAFESIAAAAGGRPHWGKLHTLDAEQLTALYPRFADFLRVRDQADPERRFANPYIERFSATRYVRTR